MQVAGRRPGEMGTFGEKANAFEERSRAAARTHVTYLPRKTAQLFAWWRRSTPLRVPSSGHWAQATFIG